MAGKISRSARKQRFKSEEDAAWEFALFSDKDLHQLPISQRLKDEVVISRGLKAGARKRQIKHLAKLMRQDGIADILDFIATRKGSKQKENTLHREVERVRGVIINEALEQQRRCLRLGVIWEPDWPGDELEAIVRCYPVDAGELRKTVFLYTTCRHPRHYRQTFRIIKAAVEKKEILQKMMMS